MIVVFSCSGAICKLYTDLILSSPLAGQSCPLAPRVATTPAAPPCRPQASLCLPTQLHSTYSPSPRTAPYSFIPFPKRCSVGLSQLLCPLSSADRADSSSDISGTGVSLVSSLSKSVSACHIFTLHILLLTTTHLRPVLPLLPQG